MQDKLVVTFHSAGAYVDGQIEDNIHSFAPSNHINSLQKTGVRESLENSIGPEEFQDLLRNSNQSRYELCIDEKARTQTYMNFEMMRDNSNSTVIQGNNLSSRNEKDLGYTTFNPSKLLLNEEFLSQLDQPIMREKLSKNKTKVLKTIRDISNCHL